MQRKALVLLASLVFTGLAPALPDFNLDNLPLTNSELNAALKGHGMALGYHQLAYPSADKRVRLGATAIYTHQLTGTGETAQGMIPLLAGGFVVTTNLLLTGKVSALKSGRDLIGEHAGGNPFSK